MNLSLFFSDKSHISRYLPKKSKIDASKNRPFMFLSYCLESAHFVVNFTSLFIAVEIKGGTELVVSIC